MSALLGLQVRLPDNCRCGSDLATVGDSDGKFAATLACPQCGSSRGAISEFTLSFIQSLAARYGAPGAIAMRSSAIAKACAKQDEYLKRKYTPTGKSWFDVITENFERMHLRRAAPARSRIHPLVPKTSLEKTND